MKKLSLLLAVLAIASVGTLAGAESRIERNLKLEPNGRFLLESEHRQRDPDRRGLVRGQDRDHLRAQ